MKTELTITHVAPDTLNPAPYNPRIWSEEEKEKLKDSLKRFGFVDPLIVNQHPDRLNVLIGGHFRLAVAKEMGMTVVPVVYLNLREEKERELNIRLNKNTGRFDFELLKDFDLELLLEVGFGEAELGAMWDLSFTTEDGSTAAKDESGAIVPRVKIGEVWELGDHRLICGDSTDPETLKRLMHGEPASMLYSDPPYNIAFDYSSGLTTKGKYGGSYADTKSAADYREFLKKALANGMAHAAKDVHVFTWNDQNHIGLLQGLYPELGIAPKRVVFWLKNNFNMTPGVAFNKAVEPCVYGVRGKPFLKKGEITGIVAWHPDRLARNSVDAGRIIWLLDQGKLKDLKFCAYTFENTPEGKWMLSMILSQAKYFVDKLSKDVKRGNNKKYGFGGVTWNIGQGYIPNLFAHTQNVDPERFDLVRKMWEMLLSGAYTVPQICRTANLEWGYRTRKTAKQGGKPLSQSMLYTLFRNPMYYGLNIQPDGT